MSEFELAVEYRKRHHARSGARSCQLRHLVRGIRLLRMGWGAPADGGGVGIRGGRRRCQSVLSLGILRLCAVCTRFGLLCVNARSLGWPRLRVLPGASVRNLLQVPQGQPRTTLPFCCMKPKRSRRWHLPNRSTSASSCGTLAGAQLRPGYRPHRLSKCRHTF
jgi:hypothetical protein